MPRPRNDRPTLEGDHDAMTAPQRRSHYKRGCGHDLCRRAQADYMNERNARRRAAADPAKAARSAEPRVPAFAAVRRLQALHHCGFDAQTLAPLLNWAPKLVTRFITNPPETIRASTSRLITVLFNQLRDRIYYTEFAIGSKGRRRALAAMALADRNEWGGPYDWNPSIAAELAEQHRRQPHFTYYPSAGVA